MRRARVITVRGVVVVGTFARVGLADARPRSGAHASLPPDAAEPARAAPPKEGATARSVGFGTIIAAAAGAAL